METDGPSQTRLYPGGRQIALKLVFALNGRILGALAIGADGADKRIDVIATAIGAGLKGATYSRNRFRAGIAEWKPGFT